MLAAAEIKLSLAALKYARHARGGRIPDPAKQLSSYLDRTPQLVEPGIVIASIVKADDPAAYLRGLHPKHPQFEKLRQRYLELKAALGTATPAAKAPAGPVTKTGPKIAASETGDAAKMRSLLANMEMWRWIPEDMGALHVWVNLPEFTLRVMKNGAAIHTERIISGLKDKQTPNFSATMETVVFHPYWSIPESIKVKDIYPSFARGGTVAKRYNLRVAQNGRLIDPSTVDWSQADIRRYDVYQPPGEGNMMGVLKFLFPNKHQTYMHDTPDKALFDQTERTFSHGCMRVRNPVSLAEVILAEDKGWDAAKIKELAQPGVENNAIPLDKKIPVHITYFTEWIGDDGSTIAFNDMYGHERRVTLALEGRFSEIVKGPDHLAPVTYGAARYAQSRKSGDMMHGFLSGGY